MITEPCTPAHIADVLANLWERGERELDALGVSKTQAYGVFSHYLTLGPSGALVADGETVAVGGMANDGEWFTWFQATDAFAEHASELTRYIRRLGKRIPDARIYSVCIHPKTADWFRVMGFVKDGWTSDLPSGATLYRFARR